MYHPRARACSTKTTDHTQYTHTPRGYNSRVLIYSYSRRNCNPGLCAGVVLNNSTIKIGAYHRGLRTRASPQPQK